jgi:hypothetical protein
LMIIIIIITREPYDDKDYRQCGYDNLGSYDLYTDWKSVY